MTVAQLPAQISTTLEPKQVARIQRAAQDFEAMAMGQMLAPMFQTMDASKGPFGGGSGEQAWQPMMVNELGKAVAKSGGIGLARPVMEQMLRLQEARTGAASGAAPAQNPPEQNAVEQMLLERPPLRRTTLQASQKPGA